MILQRAGHDLRRARGIAVRDEHDRNVGELALLGRAVVLIRVGHAAARVHDHLAARQEFVGHLDRLVERAARVLADVEQQTLHPLPGERVQRGLQIVVRVLGEVAQLDVARRRVDHEVRGHGRDRDLVARDGERNQLIVAAAPDVDLDGRAARAAQLVLRFERRDPLGGLAFDGGDDVAAADAELEGRRSLEDDRRRDVSVNRLNGDAEAGVMTFLPLAHLRVLVRIEKARVRIQRAEHAPDRTVDEPIGIDFVHVVGFDHAERGGKRVIVLRHGAVGRQRASSEEAAGKRGHGDGEEHGRERTITGHARILTDNFLMSNDFWASWRPEVLDPARATLHNDESGFVLVVAS